MACEGSGTGDGGRRQPSKYTCQKESPVDKIPLMEIKKRRTSCVPYLPAADMRHLNSREADVIVACGTSTVGKHEATSTASTTSRLRRQIASGAEGLEAVRQRLLDGIDCDLKEAPAESKGRGVFALRTFERGDFICEYAGELLEISEAKEREERYSSSENIGSFMYYFRHKDRAYCIDATLESGRLGRLINHSRCGNARPAVVELEAMPRLVFFAKAPILAGDEILFDYGDRRPSSLRNFPWLKGTKANGGRRMNIQLSDAAAADTNNLGKSLQGVKPDCRHRSDRRTEMLPHPGPGVTLRGMRNAAKKQDLASELPSERKVKTPFTMEQRKSLYQVVCSRKLIREAMHYKTWTTELAPHIEDEDLKARGLMSLWKQYVRVIFPNRKEYETICCVVNKSRPELINTSSF